MLAKVIVTVLVVGACLVTSTDASTPLMAMDRALVRCSPVAF
jgi:hypothetical protein